MIVLSIFDGDDDGKDDDFVEQMVGLEAGSSSLVLLWLYVAVAASAEGAASNYSLIRESKVAP